MNTGGPGPPPPQSQANADLDSPLGRLAMQKSDYAVDLLSAQLLDARGEEGEARELERQAHAAQRRFERNGQPRLEDLLGVEGGG